MSLLTLAAAPHAPTAGSVRRQLRELRRALRELRRALRAGDVLDALTAAARIHAIAVRPNMSRGHWQQAQAVCERMLGHIPARHAPGYEPRLRRVIECLHADAALAARAGGDYAMAKLHLIALIGCLRDRGAPMAQQVLAVIDLANVYLAANEARSAGQILADLGAIVTAGHPQHPFPPGTAWVPMRQLGPPLTGETDSVAPRPGRPTPIACGQG
jgi:hypothetical protein